MCYWIDLNAPPPTRFSRFRHALCESRIADFFENAVGASARSGLLARVHGAFTSAKGPLCCALWYAGGFACGVALFAAVVACSLLIGLLIAGLFLRW